MQQLRGLAMNNNTTGASIYDLGNIIKADSVAELEQVMKGIEERMNARRQEEMQQQQAMEQQRTESQQKMQEAEMQFRADEAEKNRRRDLLVAEIRSAGFGATVDINENKQSDYLDSMEQIRKQQEYQDLSSFKREQEVNKRVISREQLDVKREELRTKERIADKEVEIARVNKNKYDGKK